MPIVDTPDYDIHLINSQNAYLLAKVANDVFDAEIDEIYLKEYCCASDAVMFVYVSDKTVVGQIRAIIHRQPDGPPVLYIDNLGVAPDYKRMGIATELLTVTKAWGRQHDCRVFWVATEPDNNEGGSFYRTHNLKHQTMAYFEAEL